MTAPPADTPALPAFVRELSSTLAVHAQYVLHGNVRDRYPVRGVARPVSLLSLRELLWEALAPSGYECLVTFDPVDGLSAFPVGGEPGRQAHDAARRMLASDVDSGRVPSLDRLRGHLAAVSSSREVRAAFVVDYGSRLTVDPSRLERAEHDFFVYCEKLSRDALPVRGSADRPSPLYNPIIWLLEREQDLPAWLTANNERIRAIGLPRPDFGDRQETARLLARPMGVVDITGDPAAAEACQRFAEQSDGLTLQEMIEVTRLAKDRGLQLGDLPDAVRMYKLGVAREPVAAQHLRRRIAERQRTRGRPGVGPAPGRRRRRSTSSSARPWACRGRRRASRPAGPAGCCSSPGPTGVGKTELAKTIAQLVFGDEARVPAVRHERVRRGARRGPADRRAARLRRVRRGRRAHERRARQQPFRVVLFDEIEKAHPRILDKFLQILEDGRLTDGRGDTGVLLRVRS